MRTDGRTDRSDEAESHFFFRNFANVPKTYNNTGTSTVSFKIDDQRKERNSRRGEGKEAEEIF